MAGAGLQPAGLSPAGVGTSTPSAPNAGVPLHDPNTLGVSLSGRYIDPQLRQYVFDANGRTYGMTEARQLVHMAVNTTLGRSATKDLGHEMYKVDRITDSFEQRVQNVYTNALADLVNRKLIAIVSIEVTRNPNSSPSRAFVLLKYQDLTTGSLGQYGVEETLSI